MTWEPVGALLAREAARNTAATKAKIFGADLPEVKLSLDSLDVLEEAMHHFYLKAMIERPAGEHADCKAVDAAILQAAAMAKEVAPYRHQVGGASVGRRPQERSSRRHAG